MKGSVQNKAQTVSLAGFWDDEDDFEETSPKVSRNSRTSRVSRIAGMEGFGGLFEETSPRTSRVSRNSRNSRTSRVAGMEGFGGLFEDATPIRSTPGFYKPIEYENFYTPERESPESARVSAISGMEGFGGLFEDATPIRSTPGFYKPITYENFYTPRESPEKSGYTPHLSRFMAGPDESPWVYKQRAKTPTTTPELIALAQPFRPYDMLTETPKPEGRKSSRTSKSARAQIEDQTPLYNHPLYYWVGKDSEINKLLNNSIPLTTEAEAIARLTSFKEGISNAEFKKQAKLKINNNTLSDWAENMGYFTLKSML